MTRDLGPGVHRIIDLVEKPPREEAPSNLAIIGRYILTPDIFPALEATASDRTGEIQLDQRAAASARDAAALRLRDLRRAARHRQQARIPEGARATSRCSAPNWPSRSAAISRRSTSQRERRAERGRADVSVGGRRLRGGRGVVSVLVVVVSLVAGLSSLTRSIRLALDSHSLPALPFLRVVGDVPARSLELNRRRRHAAAAPVPCRTACTPRSVGIGELPNDFEATAARSH